MKKKIIPVLVCLVLAVSLSLAACGGDSYTKIKVSGQQDYGYTVHSNGGMAVQYGNYIYFVNGYSGYDDTDGKQNTWPDVVKGGLYRAELSGAKGENGEFDISVNSSAVNKTLEFVAGKETDAEGNESDVIGVQRIAPKRIGTSGYSGGGIFIYDQWVYFASPNNEKNKSGTVQTTKTDFYRARLDGTKVQKIYTTANSGNEASDYAFYKYDGAVYLVAKDGSDLVSVKITKKPADKVIIAQNVTSVVLPYSETYYEGMNENTLNHFVYVLRAVGDKDTQKSGNVIEIMRPDGKEGGVFLAQGKSDTIEAVRDGLLFYRTTDSSNNTLIKFDSLHDFFMNEENDVSPSYRAYYAKYDEYLDESGNLKSDLTDDQKKEYAANARVQFSGEILSTANVSDYTSTYCFRPAGEQSDLVYAIGVKSDSVELKSNLPIKEDKKTVTISDESFTLLNVEGAYAYFTDSDGNLCRTLWNKEASVKSDAEKKEVLSHGAVNTSATFNGDYCAGYVLYVGNVDELAEDYTFFRKTDGPEGVESLFVGRIIGDDVLSAPKISVKDRVISWDAVDNAESYRVYCKRGNETILEADGLTTTSYTLGESDSGTYWVVAVVGSVVSSDSNTVTL